jgi:peptidoglycan/LPS O-acetylase OafA/YrhL
MKRPLAILYFVVLLALLGAASAAEIHRPADFTAEKAILFFVSLFLLGLGGTVYCGFAMLHAAQRITDPRDRAGWLVIIVPFTIFGACFYLLTKYQNFRKIGKGTLIRDRRKNGLSNLLTLTHEEENGA